MELKEALTNVVNSALLTFDNHDKDNSFLSSRIAEMEKDLRYSGYKPEGICFNVPWNHYPDEQVAFVYECKEEEKYWCHMSRLCWEMLICDAFGYNNADQIISKVTEKPLYV